MNWFDGIMPKNGKRRIAKLILGKLIWGIVVLVLTQILGALPMLDYLSPSQLKLISFGLGVLLSCSKGVEMFFEKVTQMYKDHEIPDDDDTSFLANPSTQAQVTVVNKQTNEKTVTSTPVVEQPKV